MKLSGTGSNNCRENQAATNADDADGDDESSLPIPILTAREIPPLPTLTTSRRFGYFRTILPKIINQIPSIDSLELSNFEEKRLVAEAETQAISTTQDNQKITSHLNDPNAPKKYSRSQPAESDSKIGANLSPIRPSSNNSAYQSGEETVKLITDSSKAPKKKKTTNNTKNSKTLPKILIAASRKRQAAAKVSKNPKRAFKGHLDGLEKLKFTKFPSFDERELCRGCNQLDFPLHRDRWIFCIQCGDSWHLKCAPNAPLETHPAAKFLHPGEFEFWQWECPDCRTCNSCGRKGVLHEIFHCRSCKKGICIACDPSLPLANRDFYYQCSTCRPFDWNPCLGCGFTLNSMELRFCLACLQRKACHCCRRLYFSHDQVTLSMMVPCSRCQSRTHTSCLDAQDFMNRSLADFSQTFICNTCQLPPAEYSPNLVENGAFWWRRGSLTVGGPDFSNNQVISLYKTVWHPLISGKRTVVKIDVHLDATWNITFIIITMNDHSVKVASLDDVFTTILGFYAKVNLLNIQSWNGAYFLPTDLVKTLIREFSKGRNQSDSLQKNNTEPKSLRVSARGSSGGKEEVTGDSNLEPLESSRTQAYVRPTRKKNIYYPVQETSSKLDVMVRMIKGVRGNDRLPVTIGKSRIAGNGLYANRHIKAGTPVIEYLGEIIGQQQADHRERLYNAHPLFKRDCYLFRLDQNRIIDATRKANLARFINHSCQPNCESRRVNNRIMIYSLRSIEPGEELTYDYKFSKESSDDYVACCCGTAKCRGCMN